MIQRGREVNCEVYVSFLEYAKAFDMCSHEKITHASRNAEVDEKHFKMIVNLYKGETGTVEVERQYTRSVQIENGFRQFWVLTLWLFNVYSETICYAADIISIADNLNEM